MSGVISAVADFVSDAVETVGDVVEDVGGFVFDTVGNVVTSIKEDPLKAIATAAAAVATGGSSLAATLGTAGAAAAGAAAASTAVDLSRGEDLDDALKSGALAGGAAYVGGSLLGGSGAGTDYLGSQALGDAATGAVGTGATGIGINAGAAGIGLNAGAGSLLGSTLEMGSALPQTVSDPWFGLKPPSPVDFGTFNPSNTSGFGIDTGAASGVEYLGGTGSLPVGTAGLTAEQLATATQLGQVGTKAASGLGYLGGAESLQSGTAGIKGVATPSNLSLNDIQRGMRLANSLFGGQQQPQPQMGFLRPQVRPQGAVDYSPILSLLEQKTATPNVYSLLG
jgi:hypothetical protein